MKNIFRTVLLAILICVIAASAKGQTKTSDICGFWYTDKELSIIEIFESSPGIYSGVTHWIKEPIIVDKKDPNYGKPVFDKYTGLPISETTILKNIKFDGESQWDGNVYDPTSGKTYKCNIKLSDDNTTLNMKGYAGIQILGKTVHWKRTVEKQ